VQFDKVLTFMGTTALEGQLAGVSICALAGLEPGRAPGGLRVHLRGELPRPPAPGECVTVHLTNLEQYQGYQVKTAPLAAGAPPGSVVEVGAGGVVVEGSQIFTVHHSPYTMRFFEQVPLDELKLMVGGAPYALVAVGQLANLSPRFVFHAEARLGRLALYHGDGLALKTYMNLKSNRHESRLVVDLDDFSGYLLRGVVEEFRPHQHPLAYERICQGFAAGGWGKPSRAFRLDVDGWEPISPTAPASRAAGRAAAART
jgi:hypothetical protein